MNKDNPIQSLSLEQVDSGLPAELYRIVRTAMAREKKDRYEHAAEFADDLHGYLKSIE